MLTLFLYLNDVEEGGGTHFPLLDITVQPKKGSALLWPSVVDEDPESKDGRTDHEVSLSVLLFCMPFPCLVLTSIMALFNNSQPSQALPVIKGIKYGANACEFTNRLLVYLFVFHASRPHLNQL